MAQNWAEVDRRRRIIDGGLYLVATAGLATSITLIFLGMRAVLGVGGFCAEGGPYVIEVHCPPGVVELMPLSMLGLFLFGGLMFWKGAALGGPYGGLPFLAWPALFMSLGWNFLEFGFNPPGGGVALGWLIPGVVFVLMGGGPLLIGLSMWRDARRRGPRRGGPRAGLLGVRRDGGQSARTAGREVGTNLARLERLRDSGMLTGVEYEAARRAALGAGEAKP